MTSTKPDRRLARIAAAVSVGIALLLTGGTDFASLKTTSAQNSTAASSTNFEILEVRPSFFVIVAPSANVGVQVGEDGVVVVDTGAAADAPRILAAIKRISAKPIRYIIDTGPDLDHVGGIAEVAGSLEISFARIDPFVLEVAHRRVLFGFRALLVIGEVVLVALREEETMVEIGDYSTA